MITLNNGAETLKGHDVPNYGISAVSFPFCLSAIQKRFSHSEEMMTLSEGIEAMNSSVTHGNERYPLSELTSKIIACAIEVHKTLGPGFEEVFYQRALHREMAVAGLDSSREVEIDVHYKELILGKKRVDFLVEDCLVEIKAKAALEDVDKVQTLSYLKASGYPVGLLINFGGAQVEIKRLANTRGRGFRAAGTVGS